MKNNRLLLDERLTLRNLLEDQQFEKSIEYLLSQTKFSIIIILKKKFRKVILFILKMILY